jgi:hypothetical protein
MSVDRSGNANTGAALYWGVAVGVLIAVVILFWRHKRKAAKHRHQPELMCPKKLVPMNPITNAYTELDGANRNRTREVLRIGNKVLLARATVEPRRLLAFVTLL